VLKDSELFTSSEGEQSVPALDDDIT
jgi:hypothetical protein